MQVTPLKTYVIISLTLERTVGADREGEQRYKALLGAGISYVTIAAELASERSGTLLAMLLSVLLATSSTTRNR